MDLYKIELAVRNKMNYNPTIPEQAFQQLVDEEFFGKDYEEIMSKKYDSSYEVDGPWETEEPEMYFYHNYSETDHQRELDFENREER